MARIVYVTSGLLSDRRPLSPEPKNDDSMEYVRDARVFDRYYIVSPGDRQDVARRLTGTMWGTAGRRGGDVSRNFTTSLTGRQ